MSAKKEAVALLREMDQYDLPHEYKCAINDRRPTGAEPWKPCTCGTHDFERRVEAFLKKVRSGE